MAFFAGWNFVFSKLCMHPHSVTNFYLINNWSQMMGKKSISNWGKWSKTYVIRTGRERGVDMMKDKKRASQNYDVEWWQKRVGRWKRGKRAHRVAQLVERRIRDLKIGGSNPACIRSTRKICESFSESKVLCWLAIGVPNPRVYIHTRMRIITYAR